MKMGRQSFAKGGDLKLAKEEYLIDHVIDWNEGALRVDYLVVFIMAKSDSGRVSCG